jgi:hypothetical protein
VARRARRRTDHAPSRRVGLRTGDRDDRATPAALECRRSRSGALGSAIALLLFAWTPFTGTAAARPLVMVAPSLASQVAQPCVLYACASDPTPHTNWENTLSTLPADYCSLYECSPMDLIPDNGFDDNLFPLNPLGILHANRSTPRCASTVSGLQRWAWLSTLHDRSCDV